MRVMWCIDCNRGKAQFFAALIVENGRVVRAAPLLRWTVGKPWQEVDTYYRRKGCVVIREDGPPKSALN